MRLVVVAGVIASVGMGISVGRAVAAPELMARGWREAISLQRVAVVGPVSAARSRLTDGLTAGGADVVALLPEEATEAGGLRWTEEALGRTVVVMGGIHTNRAMLALYAHYLSFADADYPGQGGYTIRTISRPFGPGTAAIALEASTPSGETAAARRLVELLDGGLELPATLEAHLAQDVDARARR